LEAIVFKPDDRSPESISEWLIDKGITEIAFDADGNGSMVNIPTSWINDGEKMFLSKRVLSLV
jgi:hypothetical protein